jgi:hypothetical protein
MPDLRAIGAVAGDVEGTVCKPAAVKVAPSCPGGQAACAQGPLRSALSRSVMGILNKRKLRKRRHFMIERNKLLKRRVAWLLENRAAWEGIAEIRRHTCRPVFEKMQEAGLFSHYTNWFDANLPALIHRAKVQLLANVSSVAPNGALEDRPA